MNMSTVVVTAALAASLGAVLSGCPGPDDTNSDAGHGGQSSTSSGTTSSGTTSSGTTSSGTTSSGSTSSSGGAGGMPPCVLDSSKLDNCILQ